MIARPLVCVALLAALVPAAAWAFRISDPLAAKPAELRVTVSLPPGFAILKGSARLKVTATDPRSEEAVISSDRLAQTGASGADHVLALADPAGSQFAGLEAKVAAWRAAKVPTAAQIDVAFTPCRTDPAADPTQPMALSLQPAPGAPRLVLVPAGTTLAAYLSGSGAPIAACP
jgi:hypothetical protein